ncbi:hypothetical protein OJAV_G00064850 [Oryzias javanicus]|uniref:Protein FAM107B-like n=1 Tax=Oryzias javanicus TaxID=123683 RepID=A0A3S2PAC7_ORYJA|nr:hypothetical protein OJAV_G00064850 [Oryzias javanicus]
MKQRHGQLVDRVRTPDLFNNGLNLEYRSLTNAGKLHHPAMEGSAVKKKPGFGQNKKADCSNAEPAQARKLSGSSAEAPSYQNLHKELLLSHKRGLLLEEKPELKRVLEQRRLERHKEEEMARQRPSDLEMELRKRQQKLQEYEQEEIRQRENQQKIPEFVRVRDNLRRTQTFDQP